MRSRLLLLALCFVSAARSWAQIDFATDIPPTLAYKETYVSAVQADGSGGWQLGVTSKVIISAKCSMKGVSIAGFDATTGFSLNFNDLVYSCTLGDDPAYVPGATSVNVPLTGTDPNTGVPFTSGNVEISWSASVAYFSFVVTNDAADFDVEAGQLVAQDVSYGTAYSDEPIVTLTFGNSSLVRTVYITGGVTFTPDPSGRVSSDLANIDLNGAIDSTPPTNVSITNLKSGQTVNQPVFTILGTAQDNIAIGKVAVEIDGGAAQTATLVDPTHWSLANVHFVPGTNPIAVQAFDQDGNETALRPIDVVYVPLETLSVKAAGTGSGTVTSSLFTTLQFAPPKVSPVATAVVEQGSTVTVTAVPGATALFDHWTSSAGALISATSPALSVAVQSNVALTANFVANPFLKLNGSYQGLITGSAPITNGFFTLTLGPAGGFSGVVKIGSLSLPISGRFLPNGTFSGVFKSGGVNYSVALAAAATGTAGAGQVKGTIKGSNSLSATISSDVSAYNSTTNPLKGAGTYNVILPRDPTNTDKNFPVGAGYGTVLFGPLGASRFVGTLGDGTAVSAGGTLSQAGKWPFYISLYGNAGSISGSITLALAAGATPDLTGTLEWTRPAVAATPTASFPTGFSGKTQLLGAPWTAKAAASTQRVFLNPSSGAGLLSIDAPAVPSHQIPAVVADDHLTLAVNNTVAIAQTAGARSVAVTVNPMNGVFSGSFVDAVGKTRPFAGMIVSTPGSNPKVDSAAGYFLYGNVSGAVTITSP